MNYVVFTHAGKRFPPDENFLRGIPLKTVVVDVPSDFQKIRSATPAPPVKSANVQMIRNNPRRGFLCSACRVYMIRLFSYIIRRNTNNPRPGSDDQPAGGIRSEYLLIYKYEHIKKNKNIYKFFVDIVPGLLYYILKRRT